MGNDHRLLPEGVHAIFLSGKRFIQYDPSACDPKLLKKHLLYFSDKRLEGLATSKAEVASFAELMRISRRTFLNQYTAAAALEALEEALATRGSDRLFELEREPSSTAEVPGALTTREAVQAEIDALRTHFGIEQEVPARFVGRFSDIPGEEGTDAAFGFEGLPFLPAPHSMEIIFADDYLTYAKPYRDYLLLHEFAHCLQVLDNWPYYGEEYEHHDDSYREACVKLGVVPDQEGSYYPVGSYRITCQSCGDVKYATEDETLRTQNLTIEEFVEICKCPHCLGRIAAECIELPIFTIGEKVYEVAPNGDCEIIGAQKKPEKSLSQLHNEYGDIVYTVASYMDFRRYQAQIEHICYDFEETWELYNFEDWLLSNGDGRLDEALDLLSNACDAIEKIGDEAYAQMISALKRGQRIPTQDQKGLFGFQISEINLDDLEQGECNLFAMEMGEYCVGSNFELLCNFLKEYFEVEEDDDACSFSDIFPSQDDTDDEELAGAPGVEKVFLQVKAELSDDGSWRRFVVPTSALFSQLHYSLAVAFDCVDDIAEEFVFLVADEETVDQRDSFREKLVDRIGPRETFSYMGCNGIKAKVIIEGLCRLDPALPPIFPMVIGASEDADLYQLNILSADINMSLEEDFVPDNPDELRDAYMNLAAKLAAQCVDPNLVTPLE